MTSKFLENCRENELEEAPLEDSRVGKTCEVHLNRQHQQGASSGVLELRKEG